MSAPKLRARPITIKAARRFNGEVHRKLKGCAGGLFAVACEDQLGTLRGVAIVGRPARTAQDGWTCEVTRCATDGARNACSFLYSIARRVAQTLGYRRVLTKSLPSEGGASFRALGLTPIGLTRDEEWDRPDRPRAPSKVRGRKLRWNLLAEARS